MIRITPELLRSVMPNAGARADRFAPLLAEACARFGINTPARVRAFLATIAHESGELRYVQEIASGEAYEGRRSLGNTQPGDGKRFKGRGLIQVTGRDNYTRLSKAVGTDYVQFPGLLERDRDAVIGSCWWWQAHGCNELADTGSIEAVTRRVNGGLNGIDDRRRYFKRATAAIASAPTIEPGLIVQPDQINHELLAALAAGRVETAPRIQSRALISTKQARPPTPISTTQDNPMDINFDWRKVLGALAPTLAAAAGGPLAGMAVKVIADKVLGNPEAPESEVAAALTSGQLTGEQIVALKRGEEEFIARMRALDIDVLKLNRQAEEALLKDVQDARARQVATGDKTPGLILAAAFVVWVVSFALFYLGEMPADDYVRALITRAYGTVDGILIGATAYFIGTTRSSKRNGEAMRDIALNQGHQS